MKIEDFRKQLRENNFSKREIANYVKQLRQNGHCYIDINDRQYLCIARN